MVWHTKFKFFWARKLKVKHCKTGIFFFLKFYSRVRQYNFFGKASRVQQTRDSMRLARGKEKTVDMVSQNAFTFRRKILQATKPVSGAPTIPKRKLRKTLQEIRGAPRHLDWLRTTEEIGSEPVSPAFCTLNFLRQNKVFENNKKSNQKCRINC